MDSRWQYRLRTIVGTIVLTAVAVIVTNLSVVHNSWARMPYFGRPAPEPLAASEVSFVILTTIVVMFVAMWPLFKPRPRRLLDTVLLTQKRVVLAMIGLAALGYFNYTYQLPRTTLMLTTVALLVALPLFMVSVRKRPRSQSRAVIVGDDPEAMQSLLAATELPILGYVSPASSYGPENVAPQRVTMADGGAVERTLDALPCLGGLARLEDVFVTHDVDTALLAFSSTDREDFFGTLEACHDHGVNAMVHRDHADHVLTDTIAGGALLAVDLEPLDWQEHAVKRLFDIAFAGVGLLVLSPVIILISVAIKLDDGGPILYSQQRTATFGTTFLIHKFRSMTPEEADSAPDADEEDRVTRVGRVLRRTHFDEIPQLWAILTGKMSVVGPRAVWTDEEAFLETETNAWHKRWFIKPGLTGLAQINDATSAEADDKLRYDLQYIRQQSFWFDLQIVIRQLWTVWADAVGFVLGFENEESTAGGVNSDGGMERTPTEDDDSLNEIRSE